LYGPAEAISPVLGWIAVTAALHPLALQLCLTIFVWAPPHFRILAIFRRDDYARAQVPMRLVSHGVYAFAGMCRSTPWCRCW